MQRRETVLLVDDDPQVLELARELLELEGYRVLKANSGEKALEIADGHPEPIALLLADVVMPGLSGPDVAARLRPLRPSTKVLYMSGFASSAVAARGVQSGDPLVFKPFRPEALLRKVREVLDPRSPFARRPEPPSR
ncbi:MAG TPA: response regulator [Methylomirabilota bacterium]|jgi:CheY-like chemotaxis protein|nr:response regulator [Methylomirabilota bacterium]